MVSEFANWINNNLCELLVIYCVNSTKWFNFTRVYGFVRKCFSPKLRSFPLGFFFNNQNFSERYFFSCHQFPLISGRYFDSWNAFNSIRIFPDTAFSKTPWEQGILKLSMRETVMWTGTTVKSSFEYRLSRKVVGEILEYLMKAWKKYKVKIFTVKQLLEDVSWNIPYTFQLRFQTFSPALQINNSVIRDFLRVLQNMNEKWKQNENEK